MSNGKSTVYPVPLQDSLLNLNKYNGEIKPFSGFNKNNSPFVGGVLSTLWEKHEATTGNKKNIYVAPNGDIYKVDETGLYKNDSKIYDYNGKKFLNKVEMLPLYPDGVENFDVEKIFLMYTENNYIYQNKNGKVYVVKMVDDELTQIELFDFLAPLYSQYDNVVFFNDRCFKLFTTRPPSELSPIYGSMSVFIFPNDDTYVSRKTVTYWSYQPDSLLPTMAEFKNGWLFASNSALNSSTIGGEPSRSGYEYVWTFDPSDNSFTCIDLYEMGIGEKIAGEHYSKVYDFFLMNQNRGNEIEPADFEDGLCACAGYLVFVDKYINPTRLSLQGFSFAYFGNPISNSYVTCWLNEALIKPVLHGLHVYASEDESRVDIRVLARYMADYVAVYAYDTDIYAVPVAPCSPLFITTDENEKYKIVGGIENLGVLYNNGLLSNISDGGVLLEDWNSIEEETLLRFSNDEEKLYTYKKGDKWYKVYYDEPKIKLIANQLIINVNCLSNAYDIVKDKKKQFSRNDNNRFCMPYNVLKSEHVEGGTNPVDVLLDSSYGEYALSENPTLLLNPETATLWITEGDEADVLAKDRIFDQAFMHYGQQRKINIFIGLAANNECIYAGTIQTWDESRYGYKEYVDGDLVGLPFPSDTNGNICYNPNLFSEFVEGYNNTMFIKNGSTAYPLQVYNDEVAMVFYLLSAVENLEDLFILQGQAYGIKNTQIFSFTFNDGVISASQSVVNVRGLKFIASTSSYALFWSKANMTIYMFTGANQLQVFLQSDAITDIYYSVYNSTTGDILLGTNEGLFIISTVGNFILTDITDIEKIFVLNDHFVIVNENELHHIAYLKLDGEYVKRNIKLETGFYGVNSVHMSINDTLYLRLFDDEKSPGEIVFMAATITNKVMRTEKTTIKITREMWDDEKTCVVRYQPKTQRALGTSFIIDSPFAIASMSVSNITDNAILDNASKDSKITQIAPATKGEW